MALGRKILPLSTTIKSLPERALDQIQNRTPYLHSTYVQDVPARACLVWLSTARNFQGDYERGET